MLLKELLKSIDYSPQSPANGAIGDIDISGVAYDSRRVKAGNLFVAIEGFKTDGHSYVAQAVKNGAAAVLAQREVDCDVPLILTKNTRKALARISATFYGCPAKDMKIIGVTGTNGKTTTTYLIKQILELMGKKVGLIGTNQNMIGEQVIPADRTTPESLELHELFAKMRDEGAEYVVMEVSSHSLVLERVEGIFFEVGVLTNITQDHLDFHNTMEEYVAAKARLFKNCRFACLNADDEHFPAIRAAAEGEIITYGIKKSADIRAENIKLSERGVIFNVGEEIVRLGIPGEFSVYNALSAICACRAIGVGMEDIIKGLVVAKPVKGRAEIVPIPANYTVIIDYAHTPDGLENIIKTVRGYAKGRVITLFGCGGDRDRTKRPKMGKIAATLSDYCIVTSDNPRTENPEAIIKDILEGMKGFEDKYTVLVNRHDAIEYALKTAQPDDVIILAGKGHETYQILKDGIIDFDEREIVKEIVSKL